MAWSVLQSASSGSTGLATTKAVTFATANLSSGTKIIAYVGAAPGAVTFTVNSIVDGASNSLTQIGFLDDSTNQVAIGVYAMDTPAGDVGTKPTITATFNGSFEASILVQEVSGLAAGNTTAAMLDGTAAVAGFAAGASHAQPAYSSTAANEFLIAVEADDGGPQTVTQPGGYTLDANAVTNNSLADIAPAYKNSTGGAESGTWTFGGTTTGTALLVVAFKVAAGGGLNGTVQPLPPSRLPRRSRARARLGPDACVGDGIAGQPPAPVIGTPQPPQYLILGRSSRLAETYRK